MVTAASDWATKSTCSSPKSCHKSVFIPPRPSFHVAHFYLDVQFAGPNEATMGAHVVAGPSNSVVIDKQGMYWMAGKA